MKNIQNQLRGRGFPLEEKFYPMLKLTEIGKCCISVFRLL